MKLVRDNICVSDFSEKDIEKKIKIINDSRNNTFLHYDLPINYENTLKWFKQKGKNRLDCSIIYDDEVCGFIGLLNIDDKNKKAEFYICVDCNFGGKGIGTIATRMLLRYAFENLDLNKIYLFTEEDNIPAQKLFGKIGFKNEGLLREDLIHNGKKLNRFAYGIIRSEYV